LSGGWGRGRIPTKFSTPPLRAPIVATWADGQMDFRGVAGNDSHDISPVH